MILLSAMVLVLAGGCFFLRVVVGPTLADRVVGLDGLVVTIVCAVIVRSIALDESRFLDVALVFAFIGFVGTAAGARFVERRGS